MIFAVTLCLVAGAFPAATNAFEIHGTVTNGTTGVPVGPVDVKIVDPRHGMATEEEVKTDADGHFVARGLDGKISIYLVQVSFLGVTYTELVQPENADHVDVEIKVYDATSDWDQIRVSIPHLMVRRSGDTLSVDRIFTVFNVTEPPRTITGEGAGFKLYLPEDRIRLASLFVTSLGVPISMDPKPTDTPGIHTVDYPFKPGETRVGASFDVGYTGEQYTYREPLQYDMEDVVILAEDETMTISSTALDLGDELEIRGFKAYHLASLSKGSILEFTVGGGRPQMAAARQQRTGTQGHEIVILDSPVMNASVFIIVGFVLLLVVVTVLASRSQGEDTTADSLLLARRDDLLDQIARLDDLFETGTVSDRLYKLKRGELMDTLAAVIFRIEKTQRSEQPRKTKKRKGASHAR